MDQVIQDRAYARLIVNSAAFMGFDLAEWVRYEFAELGAEDVDPEIVNGLVMKLRLLAAEAEQASQHADPPEQTR